MIYEVTDAAEMQRAQCWYYLDDMAHPVRGRVFDVNLKQVDLGARERQMLVNLSSPLA